MKYTEHELSVIEAGLQKFLDDQSFDLRGLTCHDCDEQKECKYSFDPYNTAGDCLAMK